MSQCYDFDMYSVRICPESKLLFTFRSSKFFLFQKFSRCQEAPGFVYSYCYLPAEGMMLHSLAVIPYSSVWFLSPMEWFAQVYILFFVMMDRRIISRTPWSTVFMYRCRCRSPYAGLSFAKPHRHNKRQTAKSVTPAEILALFSSTNNVSLWWSRIWSYRPGSMGSYRWHIG